MIVTYSGNSSGAFFGEPCYTCFQRGSYPTTSLHAVICLNTAFYIKPFEYSFILVVLVKFNCYFDGSWILSTFKTSSSHRASLRDKTIDVL